MSRHTLSVLVEDRPGVLARIAGLFSRRGFNIESLAVGPTEHADVSRMTVVVDVEGDEERYTIVGAIEAKPAQGRISNESPVGKALLGLRPGEEGVAETPRGSIRLRVLRIED